MKYFEHILIENILVLLPVLLVDDVTELREVDVAILDVVISEVNDLLLHGVQPQHFHGIYQILEMIMWHCCCDKFFGLTFNEEWV